MLNSETIQELIKAAQGIVESFESAGFWDRYGTIGINSLKVLEKALENISELPEKEEYPSKSELITELQSSVSGAEDLFVNYFGDESHIAWTSEEEELLEKMGQTIQLLQADIIVLEEICNEKER